MKDRPILFSGPMVRAILDGRKTQTRRVVKFPKWMADSDGGQAPEIPKQFDGYVDMIPVTKEHVCSFCSCPYGKPCDRLWVRETFWQTSFYPSTMPCGEPSPQCDNWGSLIRYAADGEPENTPNRHYPNGLQCGAISAPDPYAAWHKRPSIHMQRKLSRITLEITGVSVERLNEISEEDALAEGVEPTLMDDAIDVFSSLWVKINGPGSWESNPFVWVIEFKRVTP